MRPKWRVEIEIGDSIYAQNFATRAEAQLTTARAAAVLRKQGKVMRFSMFQTSGGVGHE